MLRLQNISKSFPGVKAVLDVSLRFNGGEVHALCGENGAGKSTLMNIVVGNLQPDSGTIFWNDEPVQIQDVRYAAKRGISIVYQERSLVDSLSIAENIYPVHRPVNSLGFIQYGQLFRQTKTLLDELGLTNLSPKVPVGRLSAAQKSLIEIAKALAQQPSLLILDEPTASLTTKETETLFRIIRQLKEKGIGVIYISHRMAEIGDVADVVSVLKDGRYEGTVAAKTTPTYQIVRRMVGRDLHQSNYPSHRRERVALEVQAFSGNGFRNVSFQLFEGEILGIAGLEGAGLTALALALFGDKPLTAGSMYKNGNELTFSHPASAIGAGIAYIPEERKTAGLFMEKSVAENVVAAHLQNGWYEERENNDVAESYRQRLGIRTPSVKQPVRKLSGGNQQKVVLAKWLATNPDVLIVNEPTHGVDVGAKAEIYTLLKSLTAEGKSVLLISSDLPELLLLSDRIGVMYNGEWRRTLNKEDATEEKITALASGL